MPFDPNFGQSSSGSAVGSILGGIPLVGGILNGVTQMFTNSANRKFQREMYGRQRSDALADWNMQNVYNSPAQQMARLKAAGLNPNLVYGHGADAMATQAPRASNVAGTSGNAPRFDVTGMFPMLMVQLRSEMQAQQIENLKTQNSVLQASLPGVAARSGQSEFDLALSKELREVNIALRETQLRSGGADIDYKVAATGRNLLESDLLRQYGGRRNELQIETMEQAIRLRDAANARAETTNLADLKIKAEMVLNVINETKIKAQTELNLIELRKGIRSANSIKELDLYLKQGGFDWTDPYLLRQLRFNVPRN